jgi:hypothetical protein
LKSQIALVVSLVVAVGVAAWALYEKHETEAFGLRMLYLDSTTQIKNNVYVLSSVREGRQKDAVAHLERLLETKVAILEGCKNDLCSKSTPAEYKEAVQLVTDYKKKYEGK